MKTARVLLACAAALGLGSTSARPTAVSSDDAGFDGLDTAVLAASTSLARSSIEELWRTDATQTRVLADSNASLRAGSAATDTPNGLASISPPPSAVPSPPPTSPPTAPPPTRTPSDNGSVTPVPIAPSPSPTSTPTPAPPPTPVPAPLEPTPSPSTAEPTPDPTSPAPLTPDPTSTAPSPPPPEPTSATSPPPTATPAPIDAPSSTAPTPSPTPKGNIIFDIRVVNSDESTAKKYTRSDKDTTATPAPSRKRSGGDTSSSSKTPDDDDGEDRTTGETATSPPATSTTRGGDSVIGGRTRDDPINAVTTSKAVAVFHNVIRYAACTFAGISVALLLFFHYVALDPRVDWSARSSSSGATTAALLWSPNTWEFVLYLGYLQQMGSLSQLSLPRTPYFLWDFTDSFTWSLFLVQRSDSSSAATPSRRLDAVVLTGVVAFSDRIGIDEASLLYLSSLAFLLVVGALFVVYVATVLLAKRTAEDKFDAIEPAAGATSSRTRVLGLRFVSLRFLGLCLLLWLFALYPLSLFASFEIAMQLNSHVLATGSLILALTTLLVVCLGVTIQSARELYGKSERELADVKNLAVWGALYAAYTYRRRLFFVVVAAVQLGNGVLIGVMTAAGSATALVGALLVLQVAYLAAVFFQAGFVSLSIGLFTFALSVVKIANYALALAFLDATNASSGVRSRAATAFIMINSVVLIAWFVRHAIMLVLTLRALTQRWRENEADPYNHSSNTSRYHHRTYLHADDDDDVGELVPDMVEFQTPLERDISSGSSSSSAHEPKASNVSDSQLSARGSNVYVTMVVSPARERAPSSYSESSSTLSSPQLRSTVKMAL